MRALNLPGSYADHAPDSARQVHDLILVNHGIVTYRVHTARIWATSDRAYAYAFLEVASEDDGNNLRRTLFGAQR